MDYDNLIKFKEMLLAQKKEYDFKLDLSLIEVEEIQKKFRELYAKESLIQGLFRAFNFNNQTKRQYYFAIYKELEDLKEWKRVIVNKYYENLNNYTKVCYKLETIDNFLKNNFPKL